MVNPVKVSVIVPTFRSGDGLNRVIESLDAQSLPTDEFEVIFVDDGSGDDTVERLRVIAATRPNVHIIESENSGWGSRPRNIGIGAAVGEYVTFMDHDDSLFPDALRSAYEAGAAIGADFVNPKEVTNRGWSWGWDVWREDRALTDRALMSPRDVTPLIPHKLYRREFLNQHAIRFPEGPRAFWEDFYVNTEVFVHATSIAISASVPFYKWHRDTGSNSSDRLYDDVEEYWSKLGEVARFMEEKVPDDAARRWLLINHYRWWVVDLFGPHMSRRDPAFITDSFPYMKRFLERWVPKNPDAELEPANAATSYLMHNSDLEHLGALAVVDKSRSAKATVTAISWTRDGLRVRAQATWCDANGEPLLFRSDGGRLTRVLPGDLENVIPASVLDVGHAIDEAWGGFSLRSRGDRVSWRLPTEHTVSLDSRGGDLVSLRVTITATIDPATAALGSPIGGDVWEVGARFGFMGVEAHTGVHYSDSALAATYSGTAIVVYPTARGVLAFDIGGRHKPLLNPGRLDAANVRVDGGSGGRRLRVPLRNVSVFEPLDIVARIDGADFPARIEGSGSVAELVLTVPSARGVYAWRIVVNGVESKELPALRVGRFGRVALTV